MLKSLIKHEFRATSKKMWPIFIGMLVLSLITRFGAMPLLRLNSNFLVKVLAVLIVIGFGIGIFSLGLIPLIVSGGRFKKSILGQEGYLTMSLPVSSHQLIGAKLITNAVWYLLSGVLLLVLIFFMAGNLSQLTAIPDFFSAIFKTISKFDKEDMVQIGHSLLTCLEILLDMVAGISLLTVMCYAAYSIGYSVNKRKNLLTVVLIFVFFQLIAWAAIGSLVLFGEKELGGEVTLLIEGFKVMERFLAEEFIIIAVLGAVFYFITNFFITRKLNLE